MNVFSHFRAAVTAEIARLAALGALPPALDCDAVTVEPPRDPAHGDVATNAALVLAKQAGRPPRQLAESLAEGLRARAEVASAEVAGPGFLNLRVKNSFWQERLKDILEAGQSYGASALGQGRRVNVEYVSANPTGPMHVGHCRGAVFGDALATLLERVGHSVTREYYMNDAGAQVEILARSAYLRYREALGEEVHIPDGLYPGDYLIPVGRALAALHGPALRERPEAEWLPLVRDFAVARMMDLIREDLDRLGIHHEVFFSERELHESERIAEVVAELEARGLVYVGTLAPPKGKPPPEDWEPRPQTLFRATAFGDDTDRPLKKSDGSWTYFAADIAYHHDKIRRGAEQLIDVLGADHGGYVKRMQAAVQALGGGRAVLDVKLCQLVRLFRGGEPVRMSKRAGSFVTLREVVDEVGRDAVRFMMLYRKNDAPLDFDFVKVTEQSKDNPVFYVQYAHARVHSVLRNARELVPEVAVDPAALVAADLALLDHPDELGLMRRMAAWPRLLESAAEAHEPHRIAFYLYDLASEFHALWTLGKEHERLRFILAQDLALTRARLALVRAVGLVIAAGLSVLGVEPVEEMR